MFYEILFAISLVSTSSVPIEKGLISQSVYLPEVSKRQKRTVTSSPEGFSLYSQFSNRVKASKDSGYFWYDSKTYLTPFTNNSNLGIIYVQSEFTSGHIANQNGDKSYNDYFHLKSGYIHVDLWNHVTDRRGNYTASVKPIERWPLSSSSKATISSSFGTSLNVNAEIQKGITLPGGAELKAGNGLGLDFSWDKSTSITKPDPSISSQWSPSSNLEAQWNNDYSVEGYETFTLNTYYLFEIKNDAVGFNPYSFVYTIDIFMENISWHNTWWEGRSDVQDEMRVYSNLGWIPDDLFYTD